MWFDSYGLTLVSLSAIFGLFMAWGIGANDVANAMGTSVGAKALKVRQAVVVAAIFEFLGAFFAGGSTTSTIRKGIVGVDVMPAEPLVLGMLSALLAAGSWLAIASRKGWPVSTTHSIVGAIIGVAIAIAGIEVVNWYKVFSIAASWIISPTLAGAIAFLLFFSVKKLILETSDPLARARLYVPVLVFLTGFMVTCVTLFKGLTHVGLELSMLASLIFAALVGLIASAVSVQIARRIVEEKGAELHTKTVERVFAVLMVVTACSMAFAHGSNDVANAVGPIAAINATILSGEVVAKSSLSLWILAVGSIGIVLGLLTYGRRVMKTIGKRITHLTPSRGFAAELAASSTVVLASVLGIPVSTTHTLVGAVLGVGLAGAGITALDLRLLRTIAISWIITIPVGAVLSIIFFFGLRLMFPYY